MKENLKRATRRFQSLRIKRKIVSLLKAKSEDSTTADVSPSHVGALARSHGIDAEFDFHGSQKKSVLGKHLKSIQELKHSQESLDTLLSDTYVAPA